MNLCTILSNDQNLSETIQNCSIGWVFLYLSVSATKCFILTANQNNWPLLSSGDLVLANEHIISFFNFFSFLTSVRGIRIAWVLVLSEASTGSVLKNFAKFTRKDLCQGLLFNKVAALKPETLLKKGLWRRCFLWNLRNFKNTFLTEHLRTTAYMFWLSFN